jgi:hypothetical protein
MDNLIDFDDRADVITKTNDDDQHNSPQLPLIPLPPSQRNKFTREEMSVDLSNPYEKVEYQVLNAGDPFECLSLLTKKQDSANTSLHLQDGSL